jgi:16S rRNA (uracil1498-N3)-methyltransferase
MSLSRFHLPTEAWQPECLTLFGDEAAHCSRVLRRDVGEQIEIFDGLGRVAKTTITAITKSSVTTRIDSQHQHEARTHQIHLLPAMIKAEAFEWLLEKAAELGAATVRPLITTRTIVHLSGDNLDKKILKWRRHMVESAKQCHTPWIPLLAKPRSIAETLASLPVDSTRIIPALSEHSRRLHELPLAQTKSVFILIGPEGDFTPEEEALAQQHGFQPVTLGPLILRAETAAIASLAMVSHELVRQSAQVCLA